MYQFELDKIFTVCLMLERIKYDCAFAKAPGDPDMSPHEFPLPENKREEMSRALAFAQGQVAQLGLAQTAEALRETAMHVGAVRHWKFTNRQAVDRIEEIERAIQREMKVDAFFWQNILDEINKAIKAMDQKQPKTTQLAEAAAHLYNVKLAWRNAVMHPKDTYTPEEAKAIFENVKTFTSDLAPLMP